MKKKIMISISIVISLGVLMTISFLIFMPKNQSGKISNLKSYKDVSERIHIYDNCIYIVRHKVPIQRINGSYSTFRLLGLDLFIHEFDPTLESFDLFTGNLLQTSPNNYIFHSGSFIDGFLFDSDSTQNAIKIYSLPTLTHLKFTLKNNGYVRFDFSRNKFYEKKGRKLIRLSNESIDEEFEIAQNIDFSNIRIDSDLILITILKDTKNSINEFYIYNLLDKSLKKAEFEGNYNVSGFKSLKIVAYTYGISDYSMIELLEDKEVYKVKSIQKVHKSIDIYDDFEWDKKNNKLYFYDSVNALLKDEFDLYQYDENTLKQKIIHVNIKR